MQLSAQIDTRLPSDSARLADLPACGGVALRAILAALSPHRPGPWASMKLRKFEVQMLVKWNRDRLGWYLQLLVSAYGQ